jgi:2',3'-cyclic-nucleotide 2'-phosphodiesterase (5'-nucleotidase family)
MKRYLILLFVMLQATLAWAGDTWQLTILHTNDLHGWMQPFDYTLTNLRFLKSEFVDPKFAGANRGGLARRATLIAALRKEIAHPVVLIDAGDVFTRGPWQTAHMGVPEIAAYNRMGYEMLCVGNNEFKGTGDTGSQAVLLGLMRQSAFPWLAANVTVGDTGVPVEGLHPFIVRRYGAVRVGFLGLTAPRARDYTQTKGWRIEDPIDAAKRWVPIARKECDILIAVTHLGVDLDVQLAGKVEGIDAIVGGDSHTFLPTPKTVANPRGLDVPIVQDGAYGVCLGRLDLTFEKTDGGWLLRKAVGVLLPVDATVKEDPEIKRLLDQWLSPSKAVDKAA